MADSSVDVTEYEVDATIPDMALFLLPKPVSDFPGVVETGPHFDGRCILAFTVAATTETEARLAAARLLNEMGANPTHVLHTPVTWRRRASPRS